MERTCTCSTHLLLAPSPCASVTKVSDAPATHRPLQDTKGHLCTNQAPDPKPSLSPCPLLPPPPPPSLLLLLCLPKVSNAPAAKEPSSEYQGAYVHLPGSNPQPSLLLAFEYKGGWTDVKGAVAMTVLTYLLGGGNSFSSGERGGTGRSGGRGRMWMRSRGKCAGLM